jgi:hypothetical protein
MLRRLLFTVALVLTANLLVFSQTGSGTLKGKITDKKTKEPISFANIIIEVGGVQSGGATSDIDGNYVIKPIPPGKIDLKASYVGYKSLTLQGIVILPDKIQFQNLELEEQTTNLQEVEIVQYKVPLISKDQTVSGGTVTSEEIAKMANKSAESVATTVGGVGTDANGNITSIRGQRSSGTVYYIDGMRVIGSNALPQSAIEQVEVILGGTPAAYGDATGGIISVTTKGPSRDFNAGIDLQTSEFLDRFGYNRAGLNLTGPLFSKKDTIAKTKIPIMGYFIAGEFIYQQDGAPNPYQLYKIKDDVKNDLFENPLIFSNEGAVHMKAEYLTKNDMETTRHTLNTSSYSVNLSGKLDLRVSKSINMSFGGTFNMNDYYGFSYRGYLFNWDNNTHNYNDTWRVNARFTQRFPTAQDSKSFVKNVYYSIGADFSRSSARNEDADHKDNPFQYGYIGKYDLNTLRAYEFKHDTVSGKTGWVQNGFIDTLVVYTPFNYNPASANWTSQYFDFFDPAGHYMNLDEIKQNQGLVNGMQPSSVYNDNLWENVGTKDGGYGKSLSDQFSINAAFAADFGHHEIQLGFQYQQRTQRMWSCNNTTGNAMGLWPLMRGLVNAQLKDLDLQNPLLVYSDDGVFMDTINYYRKYVSTLQTNFDINLRKKLGLPVDGTDYINIDSYDMNANTISYYDKDQILRSGTSSQDLYTLDMFDADELLDGGANIVNYYGYSYIGEKQTTKPSFNDFFTATDANGNLTRPIAPYQPIYIAGYIQDKFSFKDLIFNIGVRWDRFDANQPVLKDPYLFFPAYTVGEISELNGEPVRYPANIGSNYVIYVDEASNPGEITGYRDGSNWYNAEGSVITDPRVLDRGAGIQPYLINPDQKEVTANVFEDYQPQNNFMPRISFSFPISDDALFYAHYDILTQRPTTGVRIDPISYYFIDVRGSTGTLNNPALQPEKTIDYELGFQQKINNASSLKLAVFYREMRDQIQQYRLTGAYPKTYYSYTNIDFGTVKGLTVTYDLRRTGNARIRFNYTLQFADGTGSDANAAQGIIRSEQPNLRTMNPLSFDRRHAFNISLDYRFSSGKEYDGPVINRKKSGKTPIQLLSNLGANLTITGGSGTPYTASSKVMPFGQMGPIKGSINGSRLPWQFLMNFRIDKDFNFAMGKKNKTGTINVYFEILNLLNTKNVTGVYPATGSPTDDGYLTAPEYQNQISQQVSPESYRELYGIWIDNPYNFATPRQSRFGLMFNF